MEKIEFETFREFGKYDVSQMKWDDPSSINFLSYKRYKVVIEEIEEPIEILIERLENMLTNTDCYKKQSMIRNEIERLKRTGEIKC